MIPYRNFFFLILLISSIDSSAQVIPLPDAHAHNDYQHERPLFDALEYGFTSIEVDVLLINNELFVGHDLPEEVDHSLPTLLESYLLPLDSIIRLNDGWLYPGNDQICYLMIDIKSGGAETYMILNQQLQPYISWIRKPHEPMEGSIIIFLSGNRPIDIVINDPNTLFSLDGRPEDLGKGFSKDIMPVISQSFYRYSNWQGNVEIPEEDKAKIRKLANEVHLENKMLRLWATPESPDAWNTLQDLGVDLINSDDLEGLSNYLLKKQE
jgi:hypothetical protein